jgi:1-acyl-sn-glycerol-3-phosphate acyltransferase
MTEHRLTEKLFRRMISFPLFQLWLLLSVAFSPLLLLTAVTVDLFRRSRWAALRALAFMYLFLLVENVTIVRGSAQWLFSGVWTGSEANRRRLARWTMPLARFYGNTLYFGVQKLYGMKVEIEGLEDIEHGPALLFFRHASMADTSLPGALFLLMRGWHVRYIAKRELLWDPGIDLIGNGAPAFFVRRGAPDNTRELDGIRRVTRDLVDDEAVVIFPEGTRFSHAKRESVLARLKEKGETELLERALALKNVLPPRLGGCLAMLEENTRACAVFVAHVGFERAARALNVFNGSLIGRTVRIKLWQIPFENIPTTTAERVAWLHEQWRRVDQWVTEHLEAEDELAPKVV